MDHKYEISLGEITRIAENVPHRKDRSSTSSSDTRWAGGVSLAEAIKLARTGWPEGKNKVEEIKNKIMNKLRAKIKRPNYMPEVEGDFFDVGLVMQGIPECWFQQYEEDSPGVKVIHIVASICLNWTWEAKQIQTRGAAIVALVDILEYLGFSCEVTAQYYLEAGSHTWKLNIPIKRASETFDLDKFCFVFTHTAMQRRLIFAVNENEPENIRKSFNFRKSGGYGRPTTQSDGDIYLDNKNKSISNSINTASEWVLDRVKKYAPELVEEKETTNG